MDIFCSRGECNPCRENVTISHFNVDHFCYRHFREYYKKNENLYPTSPVIWYNKNPYYSFKDFATAFNQNHKLNLVLPVEIDVEQTKEIAEEPNTEDVVGECCGNV